MKLHPSKRGWVTGWLPWSRGDANTEAQKHQKGELNEVGNRKISSTILAMLAI